MEHCGTISFTKVENIQVSPVASGVEIPAMKEMQEKDLRFVHYPDSQQLIIHLAHYGSEYGMLRLRDRNTGALVEEWPVADRLNGSVQILWDTLPIPPGAYIIEIEWKYGWRHRIELVKHATAVEEKRPIQETPPSPEPIVYRDGGGNILPDEDLIIRKKAYKDLAAKLGRRLEYKGNFRGGTIIYIEGETRIRFYHEMGGGKCHFYIDIPSEKNWEDQTGMPLARREEILTFLAQTVQREKASSWRFEIGERQIGFY